MRAVFAIATVTVMLVLFLRLAGWLAPAASNESSGWDDGLSILVGSRGHLLPSHPLTGGKESFEDAITVGDMIFKNPAAPPGLRVVLLGPGQELLRFSNFEVGSNSERARLLVELVDELPSGSIFIGAVGGAVRPPEGDLVFLDALVENLGAQVSPFRAPQASWALISVKLDDRWISLAEAYSEDHGVTLSFNLSRDLDRYRRHPGELYYSDDAGSQAVSLFDSRFSATTSSAGFFASPFVWHAGQRRAGIYLTPSRKQAAWIRWEDFPVRKGTRLRAFLAPAGAGAVSSCTLLVNDESLGSYILGPAEANEWRRFYLDLSRFEGQIVSIEFRAEAVEGFPKTGAVFGDAALVWEVED